jgi:unsaturated rhamnogalacturonyl hydrolase
MRVSPKLPIFLWILCSLTLGAAAETPATRFAGATPMEWSERMARSEMARRGRVHFKDGAPNARWEYTSGLFGHALCELGRAIGKQDVESYGAELVGSFVSADGSIASYQEADYNLDMIVPGRVVLKRYEVTGEERFKLAAQTLRGQLSRQPRTSEGGFWHKQRYPFQMWLDGLYMASPFLANYGRLMDDPAALDEAVRQILLMDRHAYDPASGLFFHGWDEKREQAWANRETGRSACFWGRAIGWYAMALVDSLDELPPAYDGVEKVQEVLRRLADGVVAHQDERSGLWWQVVDQGGREGNYLESSASAMFVYALGKGINRGYLAREKYLKPAIRGFDALVRDCIRTDADGSIHLTGICEVAGLGFHSRSGRPRDGSYDYYISETTLDNDLKGVGPFILAGMEVQRLLSGEDAPIVARGWDDVERILTRIKVPVFADRDFPIAQFGARRGEDAGKAIRAAIEACHAAGGGRVVVPEGEWFTGPIRMLGNVNLHVSPGAILKFSTDPADYPAVMTRWEGVECVNHSALIYGWDETNVAITGGGVLDGQADDSSWWGWNRKQAKPSRQQAARERLFAMGEDGVAPKERVFGTGFWLRPNFIQLGKCRNVLIEGVSLVRSPMWGIHPVLSQNVTIRGVTVSSHGPNNDGCDPECSRDVLIEDCVFDTGDDCIAIKSGRNQDGRRVGGASENLVIRRCVMKDGHGGVVLGSEISGGVRNVFVDDCEMDSPNLDRALRFKSNARRGGVLENVFMRNVRIGRLAEAVLTIDLLYEEGAVGPHPPVIRNISLDRIISRESPRVLWIRGFEGAVIDGIRIANSSFRGTTSPDVVDTARSIQFHNVVIEPAALQEGRHSLRSQK